MDPKGSIVEDLKKGDSNGKLTDNTGFVWWNKNKWKEYVQKNRGFYSNN